MGYLLCEFLEGHITLDNHIYASNGTGFCWRSTASSILVLVEPRAVPKCLDIESYLRWDLVNIISIVRPCFYSFVLTVTIKFRTFTCYKFCSLKLLGSIINYCLDLFHLNLYFVQLVLCFDFGLFIYSVCFRVESLNKRFLTIYFYLFCKHQILFILTSKFLSHLCLLDTTILVKYQSVHTFGYVINKCYLDISKS